MRTKKNFDCLRMKREIQATLTKRWTGLSSAEIQNAIALDLATSDTDLAAWWRTMSAQEATPGKVRATK